MCDLPDASDNIIQIIQLMQLTNQNLCSHAIEFFPPPLGELELGWYMGHSCCPCRLLARFWTCTANFGDWPFWMQWVSRWSWSIRHDHGGLKALVGAQPMAEPQQLHMITCDTEVKFSVSVSLKFSPPVRDLSLSFTSYFLFHAIIHHLYNHILMVCTNGVGSC